MLSRLKTAKNCWKMPFLGTFKPSLRILTHFGNLDMKWVSSGDIEFLRSKYEKKHQKVHWIGLHSTKNFGLFLFKILIKITWTLQGCPKLNVIGPSCTPPKAVRSSHGMWKPKFCQILNFCTCYSNKNGLWQCTTIELKCQQFFTMVWPTLEPSRGP